MKNATMVLKRNFLVKQKKTITVEILHIIEKRFRSLTKNEQNQIKLIYTF